MQNFATFRKGNRALQEKILIFTTFGKEVVILQWEILSLLLFKET